MKLHLLDRSSLNNKSFTVSNNEYPYFLKIWHYHPDLELVTVIKGSGTKFIGDSIEEFKEGEIVLLGKNLPHMWVSNKEYFEPDSKLIASAIAIHFKEDFAGEAFLKMPEMASIGKLIERAEHGVKFHGNLNEVTEWIKNLDNFKGFDKMVHFFKILNFLANHNNHTLLSSNGFLNSFKITGKKNLEKVYEYIIRNFRETITLKDVAEVAYMNPSAFSRFFKRANRKTFSEYLNEVRIGYACKLLLEGKYNISEVCFDSGFNNISNFNRQFKKIVKHSPKEYIKIHTSVRQE